MVSPRAKQCIVRPHHCAGVFSLVNKVITCMELYSTVRVSFPPEETLYRRATADVWSIIFEPFYDSLHEGEDTDTIINYPHPAYTNRTVANTYSREDGWRHRLHVQFSKLRVRPSVLKLADSIAGARIKECIGVLYRGEKELAPEQRTGVIPTPEAMCERINGISREGPVYLCADSHEANARFGAILGLRSSHGMPETSARRSGKPRIAPANTGTSILRRRWRWFWRFRGPVISCMRFQTWQRRFFTSSHGCRTHLWRLQRPAKNSF